MSVACHVGWLAEFFVASWILDIRGIGRGGELRCMFGGLMLDCWSLIGPETGLKQIIFFVFHALGIGWNTYLYTSYLLLFQSLD